MHRFIAILTCYLFSCLIVNAQQSSAPGAIGGTVLDSTRKPLPFVSVGVFNMHSGSLVKGTQSQPDGNFLITGLENGTYRVKINLLGFGTRVIDSIRVRNDRPSFNLGDIVLKQDAKMLEEFVVYAEKPLVEFKTGMTVYNVGESIIGAGANAVDVLRNLPLVSVDANGKITVRGKNVKVMIDGRPSDQSASAIADLLQSIPGDFIERIEVITEPSAKYSADGDAIINIVIKKGRNVGLNGWSNLAIGSRNNYRANAYVSYRGSKLMLSLNYSIGYQTVYNDARSNTANYLQDTTFIDQNSEGRSNRLTQMARLSFDYTFSKKTSLNFFSIWNFNKNDDRTDYLYKTYTGKQDLNARERHNNVDFLSNRVQLSGELTTRGIKDGEIRFGLNAEPNISDNDMRFNEKYFDYAHNAPQDSQIVLNNTHNRSNAYGTYLRYESDGKIIKKWFIETGVQADLLTTNNNFGYATWENNQFENNPTLSNAYDFHQLVSGGYLGFRKKITKDLTLGAGGRVEHTNFDIKFTTNDIALERQYTNFFPNAMLTYTKGIHRIYANVNKRINRPSIPQLNPFRDLTDPLNVRYGNPDLLPSNSNSYSVGYSGFKKSLNWYANLDYSKTTDIIQSFRELVDDTHYETTYKNVDNNSSLGFSINASYYGKKGINFGFGQSFTRFFYHNQVFQQQVLRDGTSSNSSIFAGYKINRKLSVNANMGYNVSATPQGNSTSFITGTYSGTYQFFRNQGRVTLTVSDPWGKNRTRSEFYGPNFKVNSYNYTQNQNITLQFTWTILKGGKNLLEKQKMDMNRRPNMMMMYF
ncbi:outer membrane receptor protein involved in Fe transport [Chitinophaga skermanii]|uniref:Outer membrane receptor protein involved in Fe transport n=1 Tax=Chitinophaga skermanii TaxID=331697 RepID=A0A327QMK2_9BACT|nr:TonB-dependent receptor [Chitinophaga skermanii]RAJ05268.1 outer membrane receptor protein involved in Fe transport [Chitinophaga skermanii]